MTDIGWVAAGEIAAGAVISGPDDIDQITVVDIVINDEPQYAYNLTVATDHTYFVGGSNMWVHNICEKARLGGAHKNVKGLNGNESHHMPADSVSPLKPGDGPSISMSKKDHQQTKSWGSSKKAKAYRAEQKKLIDNGNFKAAQQMDIDDIESKFGDKYQSVIKQMKEYTDALGLD